MKLHRLLSQAVPLGLCAVLAAARAGADTVDTKSGAHLVGRITEITAGIVHLHTDYAGDLAIKQSEVTALTTDAPIAVRLASGTRLDGQVTRTSDGALQIAGPDGTLTTKISRIAETWAAGEEDPALTALRRHWSYEASADLEGKTGNHNSLGIDGTFRAVLKTPQDKLQFYSEYNRQVTDHQKSADQFKAGTDYAAHFSERNSWYVRDEGGFDRVKDIIFYDIAAAGFGYDFIRRANHTLTGRAGLSYRYDNYRNPATADVNTLGADFELNHEWTFGISRLVNQLTYVPAFENLANYVITHESYYEIPLANPAWKLRLGVSNDYNSKPGPGVKKLDTTYFTRLLLDWE